jgi:D-alanyl-D-alanine dipeptidase
MPKLDFVDLSEFDPTIVLDIRYATTNNFTGIVLYSSSKCFLREKVAQKLQCIHKKLGKTGLGIKIYDAYRPLSVQRKLFEIYPDTNYVAHPDRGSKHNRGAALDVTLVDEQGEELLMPTPFDTFDKKSHRECYDLPQEAIANRQLLEDAMQEYNFSPHPREWWHFDDEEWEHYPIEDLSFEELEKLCVS